MSRGRSVMYIVLENVMLRRSQRPDFAIHHQITLDIRLRLFYLSFCNGSRTKIYLLLPCLWPSSLGFDVPMGEKYLWCKCAGHNHEAVVTHSKEQLTNRQYGLLRSTLPPEQAMRCYVFFHCSSRGNASTLSALLPGMSGCSLRLTWKRLSQWTPIPPGNYCCKKLWVPSPVHLLVFHRFRFWRGNVERAHHLPELADYR